jgi:very-short-patch-repair endonuclease
LPQKGKYHHSEEVRKKISASKSGKNNPMYGKKGKDNPFFGKHHSEITRRNISEKAKKRTGEKNPFYGKKHTLESRQKMSDSIREKWRNSEYAEKISKANSGKILSLETRRKISIANSGKNNHFYGKTHDAEALKKMSIATKEQMTPERRREIGIRHKGQMVSEEQRKKISRSLIQSESHKRVMADPVYRKKISTASKNHWLNQDYRNKQSKRMKSNWQNPEFIGKVMHGLHSKTRPEQQLDTLLQQLYPNEFKYNGRYECGISIDGLVPDFVNCNGQKKIIEMFGDYHHDDSDVGEKTERYAKYGFSLLVVWASELKNEKKEVIQRIIDFVGKPPHDSFERLN